MSLFSLLSILILMPASLGHSWVERLLRIELNGTMVGDSGYIRGAISRSDPTFTDFVMQSLLLSEQSPICRPSQASRNYTTELPPLRAHPGDFIALQYQENGHITLPKNTPQKINSGQVYVYGTPSPVEYDLLSSIHKVWDSDGMGGDRRGRLLGVWDFDDYQCYQINEGTISIARQGAFSKAAINPSGADLWCQIDIRLPLDIIGWYTLYWVWDWPTAPTDAIPGGEMEIYTSCMDIEVLPVAQLGEPSFIKGQDLDFAGIEAQMAEVK